MLKLDKKSNGQMLTTCTVGST